MFFLFPSSSFLTSTMWHPVLPMTYIGSLFSSFILVTLHLVMYHKSLTFIGMSSSSFSSEIIFVIASQYEDVQESAASCHDFSWNHLAPPPQVCFLSSLFFFSLPCYILEFFSSIPLLIFFLCSFYHVCFCPTWLHSLLLAHSSTSKLSSCYMMSHLRKQYQYSS